MTDLQKLYVAFRTEGSGHMRALKQISEQTGIDLESVKRALARASRGSL